MRTAMAWLIGIGSVPWAGNSDMMDPTSEQQQTSKKIRKRAAGLLEEGWIWLPGLAAALAKFEWDALQRQCGLSQSTYGTDRVRTLDPQAPLNIFAEIRTSQAKQLSLLPLIVEHPFRSEQYYRTLDLSFYAAHELEASDVKRKILAALDCLSLAPELIAAVLDLVRIVHIVRPPDDAYDVSHSDPQVPFSVFVSLPVEETDRGRLRLAEAVLHEAMHLQLTLLEGHAPLVRRPEAAHYSPWKRTIRPVQGVVHGLYVFGVIDAFLEVVERYFHGQTLAYVRDRRMQIAEEVAQAAPGGLTEDLTEVGMLLFNAILARFASGGQ
jgi:HEXXH motif-containing protein